MFILREVGWGVYRNPLFLFFGVFFFCKFSMSTNRKLIYRGRR